MIENANIFLLLPNAELTVLIKQILQPLNLVYWEALEAEECLHILENGSPPILLFVMDLASPYMDGHGLVRRIKQLPLYRETPFLFVTDNQDLFMKVPGLENGVYDFILAPIEAQELKTRVAKLISSHHHNEAMRSRLEQVKKTQLELAELSADRLNRAEQQLRKKKLDLENMIRATQDMAAMNAEELTGSFLLTIIGSVMASSAALFVRTSERKPTFLLKQQRGFKKKTVQNLMISEDSWLLQEVIQGSPIINIQPETMDVLNDADRELQAILKARVLIPIALGQKILAILILGPKLTGKPYTKEAINSILPLCQQLASSLENTALMNLRSTLSQYVSKEMIEYLMDHPEMLKLGGVRRKAVIMFADIRNFTGLSETMDPEKVVSLLNTYFSVLAQIIYNNGGFLDKYIGDCIMAEFGIPISQFDDIERAARTALEIQAQIDKLNKSVTNDKQPAVQMGISLHYGEVISGNLGSVNRMDYTAIGDAVNTAARLEKAAGPGEIVTSAAFMEPIKNFVRSRYKGKAKLKGKTEPVTVYLLDGFLDDDIFTYLQQKEPYRVNHFTRVSNLNTMIAKKLGFSPQELREFKLASLLLDIGRPEMDIRILTSDSPLSRDDLEHIRRIPEVNMEIMRQKGDFSQRVLGLMGHFRENFDGSGYPDGLVGDAIPLWARICRITDAFVALTSPRPYREMLTRRQALQEMTDGTGKQYDPDLIQVFHNVLREHQGDEI